MKQSAEHKEKEMKKARVSQWLLAVGVAALAVVLASCNVSELVGSAGPAGAGGLAGNRAVAVGESGSVVETLYAGQTIEAGTVEVQVVGENLKVTYNTTNGYELTEAQLWVGEYLADMPQNQAGNPVIGGFPYGTHVTGEDITGDTSYTISIPLTDLGGADYEAYLCDKTYFVAAHASLRKDADGDGTYEETQTGWGNGPRFVEQGSWATYFSITFTCEGGDGDLVKGDPETAFALGDRTFVDLGLTKNRWGWVITVNKGDSETVAIYAGAAKNDITKGELVGTLDYSYDGSTLNVSFDMDYDSVEGGWVMGETHVYASADQPTTIAPGQYGNMDGDLTDAVSDTYELSVSGDTIYLIAHAVVFPVSVE
jgi:hypothetical protein